MAASIEGDPTVMQVFPDDEAVAILPAHPLVRPQDTEALMAALDGTGIAVRAETNSRHIIGDGPLRIVSDPGAVADHPDAACVDGLDPRQWALLRQLQRPGERLPLVVAGAEDGGFRVLLCAWAGADGVTEIQSLDQAKALVAAWDGNDASAGTWTVVQRDLENQARAIVQDRAARAAAAVDQARQAQLAAARLRLVEELGRTLMCFDPVTDDLNGKSHRLGQDVSPTAQRLGRVYRRLGSYPEWGERHIAELRAYRDSLGPAQLAARRTGRELDAALDDPRWAVARQ